MQFRTLIVSLFAAVAVAQSSTPAQTPSRTNGSGGAASSGNLVATVNELPRCALGCLKSAAEKIKCNPADFRCLCSNTQTLIASIGPCALLACNSADVSKLTTTSAQVCQQMNANPPPGQVASASSLVASALATGGSAAASTSRGAAAPKRTDPPALAVMGGVAAAWAAYAM